MARTYKKRTKSTKSKTYEEYLEMRRDLERKGYVLKEQMSKTNFENYYERIKDAKRAGEIKSQPWQYLKSKETYLSSDQAKALATASKDMKNQGLTKYSYTASQIRKMATSETVYHIGIFLNENKTSIFSGDYE